MPRPFCFPAIRATAGGLTLLGVPLGLILGIIAGLLDFIPYIGPIMAGIALATPLTAMLMVLVDKLYVEDILGDRPTG